MKVKRARDSAAIAQKSRITKARKVLKKWAGDEAHIELVMLGGDLKVRGTVRQLGYSGGDDHFLFLSDSHEINSTIFLDSWESLVVERGGPFGIRVHLSCQKAGGRSMTLIEESDRSSRADEMSSLLKQLGLWARLQTKLLTAFQSSFTVNYWTGTIEERAAGVFALHNKDASLTCLVDTARSGSVGMERSKGNTIVTLSSRTGPFLVVLSDSPSNLEAAYKLLVLKDTTIH